MLIDYQMSGNGYIANRFIDDLREEVGYDGYIKLTSSDDEILIFDLWTQSPTKEEWIRLINRYCYKAYYTCNKSGYIEQLELIMPDDGQRKREVNIATSDIDEKIKDAKYKMALLRQRRIIQEG